MLSSNVSDLEFSKICQWLYAASGIYLNDSKKPLVSGRLAKRLRQLELDNLGSYINLLHADVAEQQIALNLLTTNETYFFREIKHFDFIKRVVIPAYQDKTLNVWSAAASSGEEAYSIAMLLAAEKRGDWQITGTDINTEVLAIARRGVYALDAADKIPEALLKSYCVKGKGKDQGLLMIKPEIKQRVSFFKHNLMLSPKSSSKFELIMLRNVLIYFELADKQQIVQQVLSRLRPGGYLLVGHSESISGYDNRLVQLQAGCYQLQL